MGGSSSTSYTFYVAATSGYITAPPPYTHVYSVGGPTGEVHAINASSGGLGREIQQMLFVPENDLGQANKTGAALVSVFLILYYIKTKCGVLATYFVAIGKWFSLH